ncbi:MAG: hypothetical protein QNJ90_00475 [Planctomycetota bacterium]|nr:hypothetical protein [Planctomycetota bacterium]
MDRYSWICHSTCEQCKTMEGSYPERPQRPHQACECTIVDHLGQGDGSGRCIHDTNTVLGVGPMDVDYEPHDPPYPQGQYPSRVTVRHDVMVLCRGGQVLNLEVAISYDGAVLQSLWDSEDPDLSCENDAVTRALSDADSECPPCNESNAGMV